MHLHRNGTKRLHHPLVGDLTLAYESRELPADPGLTIVTYSAEPGSPSEEALLELGRWAATRAKLSAVERQPQLSFRAGPSASEGVPRDHDLVLGPQLVVPSAASGLYSCTCR